MSQIVGELRLLNKKKKHFHIMRWINMMTSVSRRIQTVKMKLEQTK